MQAFDGDIERLLVAVVAAAQVGEAAVPVYALGGMTPDDLPRARQCGAQGVAGIRAFWL